MAEALVIEEKGSTEDIADIRFLKDTGIKHLQKYSGNIWTDYNTHDPGVTMLETLCIALAEVGYRSDYHITDLLEQSGHPHNSSTFLPPETVLPVSPVTIDDMRKQLLDIDGIRNVRVRPAGNVPEFSGLFEVEIMVNEDAENEEQKNKIRQKVREALDRNRKIGEEYVSILFLEPEFVGFDLAIEVNQRVESAEFFHAVASALEDYLSPPVHIYSINELFEKGFDTSEVFEGPMLRKGFIPGRELDEQQLRRNIYTSDLVTVLMNVKDVKAVKKIVIKSDDDKPHYWSYKVEGNKVPRISHPKTSISIWYKGTQISSHTLSYIRINRHASRLPKPFDPVKFHGRLRQGTPKKLDEFYTIQNDLPETYGVGESGLPVTAPPQREPLVHQLRGYLRVFDQVLANSFSQLDHVKHLLSPDRIDYTYAAQLVTDFPGEEYLLKPFVDDYLEKHINFENKQVLRYEYRRYIEQNAGALKKELVAIAENPSVFTDRRNRALDHLLARFGYDFSYFEYVSGLDDTEMIAYKEELLKTLPLYDRVRTISRMPSHNYIKGNPEALSGFELRMALLTGIRTTSRKALASDISAVFESDAGEGLSIDVEVFDANRDDAVAALFQWGGKKEMYEHAQENDELVITLYDNDRKPKARFTGSIPTSEAAEKLVVDISGAIRNLDLGAEGFHMVDHLLLRPDDHMKCFGFDINAGEKSLFTCPPSHTRVDRDQALKQFITGAHDIANYSVVETKWREFRIIYKPAFAQLHSSLCYSTRKEAEDAVQEYAYHFSSEENVKESIVHTTCFRDTYSNTEDPFSGIITIVLPLWPSRFGNPAYRKYIEEKISREAPAHVVVNIQWFTYGKMQEFESAYSEWLDGKLEGEINHHDMRSRIGKLLNILAGE